MKRSFLVLLAILLCCASPLYALNMGGGGGGTLTITEIDGAPSGIFTTLKFSNGAVTNNGDGSATVITGAGGGGDFSSNTTTSVDSEFVLFSATAGKTGKRATGTGIARSASGVYSASELSGDCTTAGSNVVTCTKLNNTPFAGATGNLVDFGATNLPHDSGVATANVPLLSAANIFSSATGQSMKKLLMPGATSGTFTLLPPDVAAASSIKLPAGTTDFTATGGASQVVKQVSAGAPLTVGALTKADVGLSNVDNIADISKAVATAVALANNGANCSLAGTFPNGVDASGASENCVTLSAVNAQTATYQVLAADFDNYKVIPVASGTFTITLVASGTQPAQGKYIRIINYGSGVVTIARSGQNLNGGANTLTLPASSATAPTTAFIVSDGTNYFGYTTGIGTVTSVFGRSGAVVATSGDYSASQVTNAADVTAANIFSSATGQSVKKLLMPGATSGTFTLLPPDVAGAGSIKLPAGTTDFTATGGANQVLQQASVGAPLTVGALTKANVGLGNVDNTSDATKNSAVAILQNKQIVARTVACTPSSNIITPNIDTTDICAYYTLVAPTTIANPIAPGGLGNPVDHQRFELVLKSATPQALTLGTKYNNECGLGLPTSTTGDGVTYDHFLFDYSATSTNYCLLASSQPGTGSGALTLFDGQVGPTIAVVRGAGIGGSSASNTVTLTTASDEADFVKSGALTCGAATQGELKVHTTPLQYCDNAATPTLQYTAYGTSTGVATLATAFAANGANCNPGLFPNGVDASGAAENCVTLSAINPQTATYQVLAADFDSYKTITVASGTFTITLVASGTQPAAGKYIRILNYGSGVVTIARSGQNLNGGVSSLTLTAASATAPTAAFIESDGTNYFAYLTGMATGGAAFSALTGSTNVSAAMVVGTGASLGVSGSGTIAATTATAFATNGANCSVAGTFPNGVDASGAAENCVTLSAINPQTATYQVLAADFDSYKTITVASGTFTITLVASGTQPAAGKYINVINYGSGVVTIARSGQNINGGTASLTLPASSATAPTAAFLQSDGTNYFANVDLGNVMTTAGDFVYGGASGVPTRLAAGTGFLYANGASAPTLAKLSRAIPFQLGDPAGSTLTVAATTTDYVTVPFACTISAYNLVIDAGTITVKFWKIATGTAIPTSANSINTAGVGIASGTAIHSTTVSDFTSTTVAANDILAMNVTAVATAKYVSATLQCDQ